jgi:hypothetical protein
MGKVLKRAIVTPDKHFPLHSQPAINCVIQTIEIVKPDIYVDLGDTGEWGNFSHWKWKRKKRPPLEVIIPTLDQDVKDVNKGMDQIDEALDKAGCETKHFIEGNHELWLDQFVEEHPYLPQYKPQNCLKLKERGYKYHKCGKFLKIGKLNFYHGHLYGGQYHTANHLRKLGANVMYGHWHDIQQMSATHIDGQKSAWSIGCLKDMSDASNEWLGGREHNWCHGFAIVDFFEKGYFSVHLMQIINGVTSLYGEKIDGNV